MKQNSYEGDTEEEIEVNNGRRKKNGLKRRTIEKRIKEREVKNDTQ